MVIAEGKKIGLTFVLYLTLHARLACAAKCISTDEFKVFCRVVHLLSFHVCDNDVNVVAAIMLIMHSPQQHKLWKLKKSRPCISVEEDNEYCTHHREHHRHHRKFSVLH